MRFIALMMNRLAAPVDGIKKHGGIKKMKKLLTAALTLALVMGGVVIQNFSKKT
jgi:hypothetical protein